MAKHETEMHRQRRELLAMVKQFLADPVVLVACEDEDRFLRMVQRARNLVARIEPRCRDDFGLFGDRSQMDFADRKDLRGKYLCTVCRQYPVDAENGFDTCEICAKSL